MALYTTVLTFGASALQISAAAQLNIPTNAYARRVFVEPVRTTNSHVCYVGISTVTNDGSGTGVIQELAAPASTATTGNTPLDRYDERASGSDHNLDPTIYYVHGTTGEKVKVSVWTM